MEFIKLQSPNFFAPGDMSESKILAVVQHGTASNGIASAISWHLSPASKVSSNFMISKAGVIYQLVDYRSGRRSWCNGVIDRANYDRSIAWLSDCVKRGINPNWHTVSIEHEATDFEMKTHASMPDPQFNASIDLTASILQDCGLKANHETILAHRQIAGNMKPTCPGVIFVPAYLEVLQLRYPNLK